MAVVFDVKGNWFNIGNGRFLYSFFSTVAYNLENCDWGSVYPYIMNNLYTGCLKKQYVNNAIDELISIKDRLKDFNVNKVVWNFEDLSAQPPWGDNISDEITDLSNYFVTSDGEDFIDVFMDALRLAKELKADIEIISI